MKSAAWAVTAAPCRPGSRVACEPGTAKPSPGFVDGGVAVGRGERDQLSVVDPAVYSCITPGRVEDQVAARRVGAEEPEEDSRVPASALHLVEHALPPA